MAGWFAEDVGWSLEPGGCSFMNQVGTVNENTDISPPALFNDHIVLLLCKEQRDARAFASPTSTRSFSVRGVWVHVADTISARESVGGEIQGYLCDENRGSNS